MSKQIEALKLALSNAEGLAKKAGEAGNGLLVAQIVVEIIAPLREALAEQPAQEQEPAGYFRLREYGEALIHDQVSEAAKHNDGVYPLYTSPQPAQQQTYEQANPLGGPAKVFQAMADAVRAGDSYHAVLRQYGYAETAQQQEPVAWMYQCSADSSGPVFMQHKRDWAESGSGLWTETPLYTSPQPAQQQEPFGYFKAEPFGWTDCAETDEGAIALYERPQPAQPSKPLTDEQIRKWSSYHDIPGTIEDVWQAFDDAIKLANGIKGDA